MHRLLECCIIISLFEHLLKVDYQQVSNQFNICYKIDKLFLYLLFLSTKHHQL
jgi:hypothetical protein